MSGIIPLMPGDTAQTSTPETRKLAAIMFTDMVGFSRKMGADEIRMLRVLDLHNQVIQQAVVAHHGHVIKTLGDGFLVDFPSVVNAVQCAQQIQTQLRTHDAEQNKDEQIHVRIGIHLGDIVQRDGDVFLATASTSLRASRAWPNPTPFAFRRLSTKKLRRSWRWGQWWRWADPN